MSLHEGTSTDSTVNVGRLASRHVVVTGAGRGIGRAYTLYLAAQGAKVIVNDTGTDVTGIGADASTASLVAAEICASGGVAVADTHDIVAEPAGVIEAALDHFGRVDAIVNNAGIVATDGIELVGRAEIDRVLGVHVIGSIGVIQAAWPHLRQQRFGRIVNTSSVAVFGVGAGPMYPTAKAAIIGLTRSLAVDGSDHGITVNAVMPMGYSRMAETQAGLAEFMKQHFSPELVAPFVGALLSDEVPCSGEIFAVAGGRAARVTLATSPGLVGFSTIDECLERFDEVMDMTGSVTPPTMEAEIAYEYDRLGLDLAELGIDMMHLGTADKS